MSSSFDEHGEKTEIITYLNTRFDRYGSGNLLISQVLDGNIDKVTKGRQPHRHNHQRAVQQDQYLLPGHTYSITSGRYFDAKYRQDRLR